MASAITLIGGALINGLSFTGSGYLFHALDPNNALKETERHNKAMEQLDKANIEWNHHRAKVLDYLNNEFKKQQIAAHDFQDVDYALKLYNSVSEQKLPPLPPKPKLSDFYQMSDERKNYEYLWIVGGTVLIGVLAYKYL